MSSDVSRLIYTADTARHLLNNCDDISNKNWAAEWLSIEGILAAINCLSNLIAIDDVDVTLGD